MTVYFYHTQDIQMILAGVAAGTFPPHFLYGATKLPDHGIQVVWHPSRIGLPRWKMMLRTAWKVLTCRQHYDAIYATHYRGLELIVLLRALRLFRKPLIVWHHQPIITSTRPLRELAGRLFYKGFDHLIFFSEQLFGDSLLSRKADVRRMSIVPWGMDIPSWAPPAAAPADGRMVFVSSGKELRDLRTLVEAFNNTGERLEIYICERNGEMDYGSMLQQMTLRENITVHLQTALAPGAIARQVAQAHCVCICCLPSKYTVGLTTLVEALALGKPIITSRNINYPFSVEEEGCGISVDYHDVIGWKAAITYMAQHPAAAQAMGLRAQEMAREQYNDSACAQGVAALLRAVTGKE